MAPPHAHLAKAAAFDLLGEAALYRPGGSGGAIPLNVRPLRDVVDTSGFGTSTSARQQTVVYRVQVADLVLDDVAHEPAEGDTIELLATNAVRVVQGEPALEDGDLVWRLDTAEVTA